MERLSGVGTQAAEPGLDIRGVQLSFSSTLLLSTLLSQTIVSTW